MSMYRNTSFNATLGLPVSSINQITEIPARSVIFAGVTIAFAAVVILVSSATLLCLYRKRYRRDKQSRDRSPEACRRKQTVRMSCGGSDHYCGLGYYSEKQGTSIESTKNEFFAPGPEYNTVDYGTPAELDAGDSEKGLHLLGLNSQADLPAYSIPGASVVGSRNHWGLGEFGPAMATPNLSLGGILQSTTLDFHHVPQVQCGSLNPAMESSSYLSTNATESYQSANTQFDIGTAASFSLGYPPPKVRQNLRLNPSNSRQPYIASSMPELPIDLNRRILQEAGHPRPPWSDSSQFHPAATVSVIPPLSTASTSSQLGSTEHELSSLLQSYPPQRVHGVATSESYVVRDQYHTTDRTSFSSSRLPLSIGLPETIPQSGTGLEETPSLDPSPTSAALSEPITPCYPPNLFASGDTSVTTTASPDAYSPVTQTDGMYRQSLFENLSNDIEKQLGSKSLTELDQINTHSSWKQMLEHFPQPSLKRAPLAQESAPRVATCPSCNAPFRGRSAASNLKRHKLEQHTVGHEKFPCSICNAEFTRKNYRDTHEKKEHPLRI